MGLGKQQKMTQVLEPLPLCGRQMECLASGSAWPRAGCYSHFDYVNQWMTVYAQLFFNKYILKHQQKSSWGKKMYTTMQLCTVGKERER